MMTDSSSTETFVNPYTFLPLSGENVRRTSQERNPEGALSGCVELSIGIREGSPLFIPNTTKSFPDPESKDHRGKVFYSYRNLSGETKLTDELRHPDDPVIPGSETRGMIRSLYEHLTNSCYLAIDENNLPYKRTNEPKILCIMKWSKAQERWLIYSDVSEGRDYVRGAILADNMGYYLEKKGWKEVGNADEINSWYSEILDEFGNGARVSYDPAADTVEKNRSGAYYLHIPPLMQGKIQNKIPTANRFVLYTVSDLSDEKGVPVSEDARNRFEQVLGLNSNVKGGYTTSVNRDAASKKIHESYTGQYNRKEPLIVYADRNSVEQRFRNETVYLSPACITKEFFAQTVSDLLKKNGEHQPCSDRNALCPACRLFGMIGENGAAAGKLRFEDSRSCEGIRYAQKQITLPILGTPKISSTEFYLKRPAGTDAKVWNYDYWVTYDEKNVNGKKTVLYNRTPYKAVPAGRKVYWNHRFNRPKIASKSLPQKNQMNSTVTPIERGVFHTRIHFDRISPDELELLLFCLNPGKGTHHKLGNGKPLGMGSIQLTVDSVTLRRYVMKNGEILLKTEKYPLDGETHRNAQKEIANTPAAKQIVKSCTDLPQGNEVDYPRPLGGNDIFRWFQNNRGNVNEPTIKQTLPPVMNQDQQLKRSGESSEGNRNGNHVGSNNNRNGGGFHGNQNSGYGGNRKPQSTPQNAGGNRKPKK